MRRCVLILAAPILWCMTAPGQQLDSNSITVSANRNLGNVQPDQVLFGVYVNAAPTVGFADVLAAVQSLGVAAANFSSVNTNQFSIITGVPPNQPNVTPTVEWGFNLPVPLSKLKDTVTALTNAQKSIGQNNSGLTLSFRVQTTQVSPQLQQAQTCSIPDLFTDARAQAQKLADAAGLNLGPILAVSGTTANNVAAAVIGLYSIPQVCSLTVKFAASRY